MQIYRLVKYMFGILKVPIARIGLEYNKKESLLSVYIKCFLNLPPVVGPRHMECLARVIVVKRVRRSWIQSRHATVVNIEVSWIQSSSSYP